MDKNHIVLVFFLFFILACGVNKSSRNINHDSDSRQSSLVYDPVKTRMAVLNEVIFTNPKDAKTKKSDTRILDSLIHYMNHTPTGAKIFINIYLLNYPPLLLAIEEAYDKGIDIRVIIDRGKKESVKINASTEKFLQRTFKDKSHFTVVRSEVSDEAINHQKYVLISEALLPQGMVRNLVLATSQNFTYEGTQKIQDAIITTNSSLYNAFLDNWKEIYSRANGGMAGFNYSVSHIEDTISAYFFPRRLNGKWDGKNTIIEELSKLDKNTLDQDTIRVLMAGWSGASGKAIAKKLVELSERGAIVEVITRDLASPEVKIELQKLIQKDGYLKIINSSSQGLHSKTMLIKGVINGKLSKIILTGSHNYSTHALKYNNEFILKLSNSSLFDDYWRNWDLVKQEF